MRPDITDKLVHFTKGATFDEAYGRLKGIIRDGHLAAGNGMIKGGYSCVCFSKIILDVVYDGLKAKTTSNPTPA